MVGALVRTVATPPLLGATIVCVEAAGTATSGWDNAAAGMTRLKPAIKALLSRFR